jgi:hypothetical protein
MLSARPAEAFRHQVVVLDRSGVTLIYVPQGPGTSEFNLGVSYPLDRNWDALVGYGSATGNNTSFKLGGRYHLRPPGPNKELHVSIQFASDTVGGASQTGFLLGGGLIDDLAPTLKAYYEFQYQSQAQTIYWDLGFEYQVSQQFKVVVGTGTGAGGGYVGVAFTIPAR